MYHTGNTTKLNIIFMLVLVCLATVNVFTITWFPDVWMDEVFFTDPAVSFIQGKGFTSSVWYSQSNKEFWTGNLPLYEYLLIPWIKLFGFSITSVRAVSVFYFFLASILLWRCLSITGFIKDHKLKILFIAALWLGENISLIYRQGRSDTLTILIAAATLYIFLSRGKYRNLLTYIIGFLSLLPGIQLPPFIVVVLVFCMLVSKNKKPILQFTLRFSAGVILGLCSLLLFLYSQGVAYVFLTQTFGSGVMITGDILQTIIYSDDIVQSRISRRLQMLYTFYNLYLADISGIWLSSLYALLILYGLFTKTLSKRSLHFFFLYLLIPPAMLLLGRYPVYYSWMGYIVLLTGLIYTIEVMNNKPVTTMGTIVIVIACLSGLPYNFIKNGNTEAIKQQNIARLVQSHVSSTDIVYGDHIAYYPCKKQAREFYATSYAGGRNFPEMASAEKESINILIIHPAELSKTIKKIGGNWEIVANNKSAGLGMYRRKP